MPELPEVEALARHLDGRLRGHTVDDIRLFSIAALKTVDPPAGALRGLCFQGGTRHGKFLDLRADPLHLVIHLARAGWLRWHEQLPERRPTVRGRLVLQLKLDDGAGFEVTEQGHEKRLALYITRDSQTIPGIARLGIDVLDPAFDPRFLERLLTGATGQIKRVLSDQTMVAGIGNAYSDEILHAAHLSPFRRASSFGADEIAALHAAATSVIGEAVNRAVDLDPAELKPDKKSHMNVHGRTGQPCPVCQDVIREVSFASRSLQYCPRCQTGGRLLADRRMSRLLK